MTVVTGCAPPVTVAVKGARLDPHQLAHRKLMNAGGCQRRRGR